MGETPSLARVFDITLPDHLGIYRQRTWVWPGFSCRSAVPFEDLWAKHLAWLGFLISLYQTTWGFIGRGPGCGQAFHAAPVDTYPSTRRDKIFPVFQKIMKNTLELLICTAFRSSFLLVKLLQVAYIPRPFEGFAVHPLKIECPQSGL
jgi:hypothetical protein